MEKEEWKVLPGYNGKYEISNLGRLRSYTYLKGDMNRRDKYFICGLVCEDGKRRGVAIHRLVAMVFVPNPDNKPHVNHKDFDRRNNRSDNLEWVTPSENILHSVRAGRYKAAALKCSMRMGGPGAPTAKMTWEKVDRLRALYRTGNHNFAELGRLFSISDETARWIALGKSWQDKHRPKP